MRSRRTSWILAAVVLVGCGAFVQAQDAALDDAFKAMPQYKIGQSRKALDTIEKAVVASQPDASKRAALAAKLASYLSTDATYEAKDFCCRQLYLIGTKAEIPAVAKLLADEKLSHMSRYVLEAMADSDADAAMREALPQLHDKVLNGVISFRTLLIGVINSLGNRRDAKATPELAKLVAEKDASTAAAAAAALGKIGGDEAIKALEKASGNAPELGAAVSDAYLQCADKLLEAGQKEKAADIYMRMMDAHGPLRRAAAGLRGLIAAAPDKALSQVLDWLRIRDAATQAMACGFVRQFPGAEATKSFAEVLSESNPPLNPSAQVLLIDALASRGDMAAKPAILKAAKADDEQVRIAAIKALADIGDASDVAALAALVGKTGPQREAARNTLARVKGASVDSAILAAMHNAPPEVRVECCKALAARHATSAIPAIRDIAAKDDVEVVRCAAIEALGALTEDKDFPLLVNRLLSAKTPAERAAAENAMSTASLRMRNRDDSVAPIVAAMEKASPENKKVLLNALTKMGGEKPLEAVRAAMKDSDEQVAAFAVRCILSWPDAGAIPDMMSIAKSGDQKTKVLAFRGLVQVLDKAQTMPAREKLATYGQLLQIATRADEKKLVIGGLGNLRDPGAIDLLTPLLSDNDVKAESASSIVRVARALRNNAKAKAALQQVIDANISDDLANQAKQAMTR